eukprot:gene5158-25739_t
MLEELQVLRGEVRLHLAGQMRHALALAGAACATRTGCDAGGIVEGGREAADDGSDWHGFMAGGYTMGVAALTGLVADTFETAVTWDRGGGP